MQQTAIPKRLHDKCLRFILVKKKSKAAAERGWNTRNNYAYNDEKLRKHLEEGGNYGVLGGGKKNLVIIDADTPEISDLVLAEFPQTFTVQSTRGKRHYYFWATAKFTKKSLEKDGKHYGDLIASNSYAVGPGSARKNGTKYKVIKDLPISRINASAIRGLFGEYFIRKQISVSELMKAQRKGMREDRAFKLSIWLKMNHYKYADALALLSAWNRHNIPPLKKVVIEGIIRHTYRPNRFYRYKFVD